LGGAYVDAMREDAEGDPFGTVEAYKNSHHLFKTYCVRETH
jgi:hypothetical protein